MKTRITFIALIAFSTLLFGCVTSSDKLNDLRIGMTKAQVMELMGKPDSMSAQANVEYLTYYLISDAGYGRDQPYMVRLVDGKVESFGRFLQLFDLYSRPVTNTKPGDPHFPSSSSSGRYSVTQIRQTMPTDLAGQIEKLKALKDQGILTDEEFQKPPVSEFVTSR